MYDILYIIVKFVVRYVFFQTAWRRITGLVASRRLNLFDPRIILRTPHNIIFEFKYRRTQAVKYGDTVYLSGTLGLDPCTGKLVDGGAGPEIKKALENIKHVLEASQSSFSSIVKTTVLLADIKDGPTVNEIYKQFFVPPYPARAMFQVVKLPLDAKVEIEVIAAVNK